MESLALAAYAAGSGAGALAGLLLIAERHPSKAHSAAFAFFIAVALLSAMNALSMSSRLSPPLFVLSGALLATLMPLLWLYVDDMTADIARVWHWRDSMLFIPAALMAALAAALAPFSSDKLARFVATPFGAIFNTVASSLLTSLTIVMALEAVILIGMILRTLGQLRSRLKLVVSNTHGRDLAWLYGVAVLLLLTGAMGVTDNLGLVSIPDALGASVGLAFILALASWIIRQRPSFQLEPGTEARVSAFDETPTTGNPQLGAKYEKSLLDEDRMQRIAEKIAAAFQVQALHLDANLSLRKLSSATGVSETHLSQTFSRQLQTSFFDYVNARRVAESRTLLAESDETIIAIAMQAGFNSRSAFYNAFKHSTGMTPSAFRSALHGGAHFRASTDTDPPRRRQAH